MTFQFKGSAKFGLYDSPEKAIYLPFDLFFFDYFAYSYLFSYYLLYHVSWIDGEIEF